MTTIDFNGKRALITGAGKGIGRAITHAIYNLGATTFALSRTEADLNSLKQELPGIHTVCVDLADWHLTRAAVEAIGAVDLLVNNAGVGSLQRFVDATPEEFDRILNINVKAVFNVSQVVSKNMISRNVSGSIVNVSSQASLKSLERHLIYSMSKAALDSMTKTMALELGHHNIRVNSVNPTVVLTDMGRMAWSGKEGDELKAKIPLNKFAELDDVIQPILFLLSDNSAMIDGCCLPIEGGFLV